MSMQDIKVEELRGVFHEIVDFLSANKYEYWICGGMAEMVEDGVIKDKMLEHDIDFHVLEADRNRLRSDLKNSGYKIKQDKDYKIRLCGDEEQRGVEFVFLKPKENSYEFQSQGIFYKLPKLLFQNKTVDIDNHTVRIPHPIKKYVETRHEQRDAQKLITDVKSLNLPAGSYALFGSAPIIVRGIREASHDIDIIVNQEVWDEYKGKPGWITQPMEDGDEYLEWEGHSIELWRTWGPGEWDVDKIIGEAEMIDGLPYARLQTVLDWKKHNGRPKDLEDVTLIENYLKNN